ncbi:unnamed protein product [Anisakis simplex]|uniref:TGF-beta family profile domain-containing protein n=1 Tax=Anisakis simplex TaxID=6269 RepID=A0A0M3K1K0_ANISI|nr:unnamed protein product [Anisakis simplex]
MLAEDSGLGWLSKPSFQRPQGNMRMKRCPLQTDRCCSLYFDNRTNAASCWFELVHVSYELVHVDSYITCHTGVGGKDTTICPMPDNMCCAFYYDNGTDAGMCWNELVRESLVLPQRVTEHRATRVCCRPDICNDAEFIAKNKFKIELISPDEREDKAQPVFKQMDRDLMIKHRIRAETVGNQGNQQTFAAEYFVLILFAVSSLVMT